MQERQQKCSKVGDKIGNAIALCENNKNIKVETEEPHKYVNFFLKYWSLHLSEHNG